MRWTSSRAQSWRISTSKCPRFGFPRYQNQTARGQEKFKRPAKRGSRHIIKRLAFQLNHNALGKFTFREYCVEFFPLLKGYEERERFAVSCYGSLQTVERGRIFGCSASCYLGVCRQFEHAFYDLSCMTRTRLSHGPGLPISVVQLHPRADNVISRASQTHKENRCFPCNGIRESHKGFEVRKAHGYAGAKSGRTTPSTVPPSAL